MRFLETEKQERFIQTLEAIRPAFARFCRAITADRELGKDLASDSILIVYEHFDSLRDPAKFKSYLFTTAMRLWNRRRYRERNRIPYDHSLAETIKDRGSEPDATADIELLYQMLRRLPKDQCEAIVLFEISGLSLEEIREIQGGSLSGVKSRIVRARAKLAILMGEDNKSSTFNTVAASTPNILVYSRTSLPVVVQPIVSKK